MTPLAREIWENYCEPKHSRGEGVEEVAKALEGAAHFRLSDASWEAANDLVAMFAGQGSVPLEATFAPAPLTVLEFEKMKSGGLLLIELDDGIEVRLFGWRNSNQKWFIEHKGFIGQRFSILENQPPAFGNGVWLSPLFFRACLTLINMRRQFGASTVAHQPHKNLIRALRRGGMLGRFPLQAWTEINLPITPPKPAGAARTVQGPREVAYHWVRAHVGHRHGKLVKIRDCWKGNPALGIRRSRYLVGDAR